MLRRIAVAAAALLAATVAMAMDASPANAGASCKGTSCWAAVSGTPVPGTQGGPPGDGGSNGPAPQCFLMDGGFKITFDCWSDQWGAFEMAEGCFLKRADPQPPAGDPAWAGHAPTDGAVYDRNCPSAGGGLAVVVPNGQEWRAGPPPGTPVGPTPAQVAAEALAELTVYGPQIGTAPQATGHGLVGLPVWLWTDRNADTWGPIKVSKTDGGITVNLEADAQYVVWDMGDGHSVRCDNPGTSFSGDGTASPTCGYRYLAPSRDEPGGAYTVTATTHWLVTWAANTGDGGTLSTDVPDTTTITIDELEDVTS
jgi:hypothetical protein